MKKNICILLTVLLCFCTVLSGCDKKCVHDFGEDNVCTKCGEHTYEFTSVPAKYIDENITQKGTVVSENYIYNNQLKQMHVYLPYGYDAEDENTKYDVLYLLHGANETEGYWFKIGTKYSSFNQNKTVAILDNLIYYNMCKPVIVVTPNTYDFFNAFSGDASNQCFREGIVRTIEEKYNTYADGDVSDASLIASRAHRGMAGFSMGGMATFAIGMQQNLDIISYFGCYTGSGAAADLLRVLEKPENKNYPINFFYNGQGTLDLEATRSVQMQMIEDILADGRFFNENVNFVLNDKENKGHKYDTWIIDLYNTLTMCFYHEQ